jgi:hypothetical protein
MHGTIYEERDGHLARIVDRTGAVHAELSWVRGATGSRADLEPVDLADRVDLGDAVGLPRLVRLAVANAVVDGAVISHPLLGAAHLVGDTAMSALAWARPREIPAIAEPGRLPLGAGAAILNTIAVLAQRAGVPHLRYAGPYPTAALWRTLARSFRCGASEDAFTAGALDRALRVARDPIAVDFVPAPHERIAIAGGFVELRGHIERVIVDGIAYEPGGSLARLVVEPSGEARHGEAAEHRHGDNAEPRHCEIWFGDAPYARVATLAPDGTLLAGPHAIPPCESSVLGREFPLALRIAIAELVAGAVPTPLAAAARDLCAAQGLRWADLGARAAREDAGGFAVHAALWDRIAPLGLGRLALALAEALAPVVITAVVRRAASGTPRLTSEPAA